MSPIDLAGIERSLDRQGARQAIAETAGHDDPESLVLRALGLMSIGRGDSPELQRMLEGREDSDPSVRALSVWADRKPKRSRHARIANLKKIVEAYPTAALPRLLLARTMIEERMNVMNSVDECLKVLRSHPDSCLARSYLALAYFSQREHVQALRSLDQQSSCPPTLLSLQVEMMSSLAVKDWARGISAYESRSRLLGKPAFPRLVQVWAMAGRLFSVAFGLVAAAGIGFEQPVLFSIGMVALATLIPISRHVTRSWRPAIAVLIELSLLWGLYLLNGL
jgi:hypothetical protein